jgi:hypothetical protein
MNKSLVGEMDTFDFSDPLNYRDVFYKGTTDGSCVTAGAATALANCTCARSAAVLSLWECCDKLGLTIERRELETLRADGVLELCRLLGWDRDLEALVTRERGLVAEDQAKAAAAAPIPLPLDTYISASAFGRLSGRGGGGCGGGGGGDVCTAVGDGAGNGGDGSRSAAGVGGGSGDDSDSGFAIVEGSLGWACVGVLPAPNQRQLAALVRFLGTPQARAPMCDLEALPDPAARTAVELCTEDLFIRMLLLKWLSGRPPAAA